MDFILIFKFLLETFKREKIDFALIGGFALQAAGITRTTGDIDMLVLKDDSEKIKDIMIKHRYELIHESSDVLNFYSDKFELGRIDFLLAHRKYALSMLKRAEEKDILKGEFKIKVIKIEDQIGLKVQSSSNDPLRMSRDMADIEQIIKYNYQKIDIELLREYFRLFDREPELDEIIKRVVNA
ncbi:MAG: nucleotidyltransferase family protein [Candidatus Omnitrophota bacterium]|nr:nucleotidyltransferase family protein [Candidatus Omnitrophota bacterium]